MAYALVRATRRSVSLSVEDDGSLLVRAPLLMPRRAIDRFVADRQGWIDKQRQALRLRVVHTFLPGDAFPFCGETLPLAVDAGARGVRRIGGRLIAPACGPDEMRERLIAWYRAEAKAVFAARVRRYSPLIGVTPGKVRVSGARTRWGSCGKGDSINLNWRLLLAPPDVLDYVVVHELSHIGQRDHSGAFWARVERFVPDWREKRKWLHDNRAALEL